MTRKIITNNASRTIKKKPKTERGTLEQLKKAVEKYAVRPVKFFPGTPISPGDAVTDYIQKMAANQHSKFKKELIDAYLTGHKGHQSVVPSSPYLGGQAIATSDYQPWKPGNIPTAAQIEDMLHLLGKAPELGVDTAKVGADSTAMLMFDLPKGYMTPFAYAASKAKNQDHKPKEKK